MRWVRKKTVADLVIELDAVWQEYSEAMQNQLDTLNLLNTAHHESNVAMLDSYRSLRDVLGLVREAHLAGEDVADDLLFLHETAADLCASLEEHVGA